MSSHKLRLRTLTSALVAAGLLAAVQPAQALNQFLKTWQDRYPTSRTDDADCNLCHGTSNNNLNAYAKSLCDAFGGNLPADIVPALIAIEGMDSDLDPTASTNLQEINADAQPGWTMGAVNEIYDADVGGGCLALVADPISVPGVVPLPYDPPVDGAPVADPNGPYAGYVNVPITFDGSGSYDSDNIDTDGDGTSNIVSYAWTFGDGETGTGMTPTHTYALDGQYVVELTVTDDEGQTSTNSTIATISPSDVLDLDIAALKVSGSVRVGKPISIQLSVENPGTVLGQALATVVGSRDGIEVYRWSLNVFDNNKKGTTSFTFPSYTPPVKGTINWNATIADVNPDLDLAKATTIVK